MDEQVEQNEIPIFGIIIGYIAISIGLNIVLKILE